MDLFWVLWMIAAYPRWRRPDLHFFSCLQGWKHYSSESYRLLRKETGSNVTGDTFVGSKHHSPLHKLGLAEFPIEKVLENTRHVKLKRTCPQHAIVCVCVCVCVLYLGWNTQSTLRGASMVAQTVKNLPAMQETWVWSLGQEYALEKAMAIHSSILAWKVPSTGEPGGLQSGGSQRVGHDWVTNTHTSWHLPDISDSTLVMTYYFFIQIYF